MVLALHRGAVSGRYAAGLRCLAIREEEQGSPETVMQVTGGAGFAQVKFKRPVTGGSCSAQVKVKWPVTDGAGSAQGCCVWKELQPGCGEP